MAAASAAPPAVPSVNLARIIELLHTHLTAAVCNTVFQRVRNRERQRRWSLAALAQFWLTVLLTGPRSLTQALREWFPEVWILDGTRLDAVAHRLKLTWDVRSPLLPGCLLVCYDLFRGFPRRLSSS